jgi:hypothetical protein
VRTQRLVIRTYDKTGLAREAMTRSRRVAGVILQGAGLQAVWRDCTEDCGDALGPREMIVRIVAAPQGVVAESNASPPEEPGASARNTISPRTCPRTVLIKPADLADCPQKHVRPFDGEVAIGLPVGRHREPVGDDARARLELAPKLRL